MKRYARCILALATFSIFGMFTPSSFGRLGETYEHCDERYGEPFFLKEEDRLMGRAYEFEGKDVSIIFIDGISAIEIIKIGSTTAGFENEGQKFAQESLSFAFKLLTAVYKFSEDDAKGLTEFAQEADGVSVRSEVSNDSIQALFRITEKPPGSELESSIWVFSMEVIKPSGIDAQLFQKFHEKFLTGKLLNGKENIDGF